MSVGAVIDPIEVHIPLAEHIKPGADGWVCALQRDGGEVMEGSWMGCCGCVGVVEAIGLGAWGGNGGGRELTWHIDGKAHGQ